MRPLMRWMTPVLLLSLALPSTTFARKRKKDPSQSLSHAVQEMTVAPPVDGETCFTPEEPCDIKLAKFMASAQKSLDVAIFDLNLDQLAHQILVQSRKIAVRVVVDRRQAKNKDSLVPLLIKGGVQVRIGRQRGIMHNKFTIVDGRMIETGSYNYTHGAAFNNNENQLYLANPAIVKRYQERFERIWREASPANS